MQQLLSWTKIFSKDQQGGIAMMFGLMLVVFVLLLGGGIEFGMSLVSRSHLQTAGDTGALSAAIVPTGVDARQVAERYFNVNYRTVAGVAQSFGNAQYQVTGNSVRVTTNTSLKSHFLRAGSSEKNIPVGAVSEVGKASSLPDFDLVIISDNSGSMNAPDVGGVGRKIDGLKNAANALIDIVMSPEAANIRIGLVRYASKARPQHTKALTSSKSSVVGVINTYGGGGGQTCGECAMYNAGQLLNSVAPTTSRSDGKTYSTARRILFMTDGKQNRIRSDDDYSATAKEALVSECTRAKATGIYITTVGFGEEVMADGPTQQAMRDCASNRPDGTPDAYLANDSAELRKVYEGLAGDAKSIRLTK